jgi:hypothetical protein
MEPLLYGTIALWNHCFMEPLLYGTIALWNHCFMEPLLVETLSAKARVKALGVSILPGTARRDVKRFHALLL